MNNSCHEQFDLCTIRPLTSVDIFERSARRPGVRPEHDREPRPDRVADRQGPTCAGTRRAARRARRHVCARAFLRGKTSCD